MTALIQALFPQGHRKLVMSVIGLIVGVGIEKFGGGLSPNMSSALVSIVAIFTGGNVLEHLSNALRALKGTKAGAIIEAVIPGDQGLGAGSVESAQGPDPMDDVYANLRNSSQEMASLRAQIQTQAQNMGQLVGIINQLRGPAQGPQQASPARPPQ